MKITLLSILFSVCIAALLTPLLRFVEKRMAATRNLEISDESRAKAFLRFCLLCTVLLSAVQASGSMIEMAALMFLFSLCWAAASFDLTFRIIPNETVAVIFLLGLAMIPLGLSRTGFLGYFFGVMVGGAIYLIPHLLGGKAGGGDVKLMAAIGGITGVTGVLIVSIFMGLLIFGYSILSITSRSLILKRAIPLGPYMSTALVLFMINH